LARASNITEKVGNRPLSIRIAPKTAGTALKRPWKGPIDHDNVSEYSVHASLKAFLFPLMHSVLMRELAMPQKQEYDACCVKQPKERYRGV
jgi:hypothetical protein